MKTSKRKITRSVNKASQPKKRKRLSGWQYEQRRREKRHEAAQAAGIGPTAVLVPQIGELETVAHWHAELADIYRRTRVGILRQEDGTKLAWIAKEASRVCSTMQELRELEQLRAQLQQLSNGNLPQVGRTFADAELEQ